MSKLKVGLLKSNGFFENLVLGIYKYAVDDRGLYWVQDPVKNDAITVCIPWKVDEHKAAQRLGLEKGHTGWLFFDHEIIELKLSKAMKVLYGFEDLL